MNGPAARFSLAGAAALGYRSDLAGLEAALGIELGGAALQVFNFWIDGETGWLLEVDLALKSGGNARVCLEEALLMLGPGAVAAK